MIFHENRLLSGDSRVISYLIFVKIRKMSQNLSSAAVLIGALRVKIGAMIFLCRLLPVFDDID